MYKVFHYFGRFQSIKGDVKGLPSWARSLLALVAIPGVLLIALSILAFFVSLLALLLLTVPVYSALKALTVPRRTIAGPEIRGDVIGNPGEGVGNPRRHIDVTIVE